MDPQRWQHLKNIINQALEQAPEARDRFLAAACGADAGLEQEAKSLLGHLAAAGDFLEPASDSVARESFCEIGSVVDGTYRILELVGEGGMGRVYRAVHMGTGRTVALKVIAPEWSRFPEFLERFRREAQAAGRLHHPRIVNVTDFGVTEIAGCPFAYLVMEFLTGETLGAYLKREKRCSPGLALDLIGQIAAALDAAHREGIVHRDLKPDNVWLQPDGQNGFQVKILDFGIARRGSEFSSFSPESAEAPPVQSVEVTQPGAIIGTPLFMSPEQGSGEAVDARSDIYSLAVITFLLLTGKTPFSGTAEELLHQHRHVIPPLLSVFVPSAPTGVVQLVAAGLAKNPAGCPASTGAFAAMLRIEACHTGHLLHAALLLYLRNFRWLVGVSGIVAGPILGCYAGTVWVVAQLSQTVVPFPVEWVQRLALATVFFWGPLASWLLVGACSGWLEQPEAKADGWPVQSWFRKLSGHLWVRPAVRWRVLVWMWHCTLWVLTAVGVITALLAAGIWIDFFQTETAFQFLVRPFQLSLMLGLLLLCYPLVSLVTALAGQAAKPATPESPLLKVLELAGQKAVFSSSTMPQTLSWLVWGVVFGLLPSLGFFCQSKLLPWAARLGYVETVRSLIGAGVTVNRLTESTTVLCEAIRSRNAQLVFLLLKRGADIQAADAAGKTALDCARSIGQPELVLPESQNTKTALKVERRK